MGLIDRDEKIPMSILSRTRIGYSDSIEQMPTWKTWNRFRRVLDPSTCNGVRLIIPLGGRIPRLVEHGERWLICLLGFRHTIDPNSLWFLQLDSLAYWRSLDSMKKRKKRLFRIDYTIQGAARRSLNLENAANLLLGTGIEFQADYWFRSFEYCCGSLNIAIMELYYNSEDIYIYVFQIGKIILIILGDS